MNLEQNWIFTFGAGQAHQGHYVKIHGTYESARKKMVDRYGLNWCFQYTEEEWNEWLNTKPSYVDAETEIAFDE